MNPERIVQKTELTYTIRDGYPVSPGHMLIIPISHVCSLFGATPQEKDELLAALDAAKIDIDAELQPDGYSIGINDGSAAGQTVAHLHIHLIPRFTGDQQDPRGGVRWIFPEKANYWDKK